MKYLNGRTVGENERVDRFASKLILTFLHFFYLNLIFVIINYSKTRL